MLMGVVPMMVLFLAHGLHCRGDPDEQAYHSTAPDGGLWTQYLDFLEVGLRSVGDLDYTSVDYPDGSRISRGPLNGR